MVLGARFLSSMSSIMRRRSGVMACSYAEGEGRGSPHHGSAGARHRHRGWYDRGREEGGGQGRDGGGSSERSERKRVLRGSTAQRFSPMVRDDPHRGAGRLLRVAWRSKVS